MIDRNELAQELMLRENVRGAIRIIKSRRERKNLMERQDESNLRGIIRSLISESNAVASVAKHDSTGINALEDLLKNTNVLSVLETGYKSLTTDEQQRVSYRNHILAAVEKALAPEESRKMAGQDEELGAPVNEEVTIDIESRPEDDPDFISVEDEEVEEVDPKEEFGLNGEDKTGRNRAFTDFQDIEKNILTAFDDLDNAEDSTMFEVYLLKNLALYFDTFETDLQTNVEEPAVAAAASEEATAAEEPDTGDEAEITNIELQEVLTHLNIEDLIKNLL